MDTEWMLALERRFSGLLEARGAQIMAAMTWGLSFVLGGFLAAGLLRVARLALMAWRDRRIEAYLRPEAVPRSAIVTIDQTRRGRSPRNARELLN
jgi:hypothetical protein